MPAVIAWACAVPDDNIAEISPAIIPVDVLQFLLKNDRFCTYFHNLLTYVII